MAKLMTRMPQVMINVTVNNDAKRLLDSDSEILNSIDSAKSRLGDRGRILVRASGTEPLIRVMAEGSELNEIKEIAEAVAEVIENRLS